MKNTKITVIGGGLAGSEAAWQAAERGHQVFLYEMRPKMGTGAHVTDYLAELVCSNSLGSDMDDRASGLLKNELRRMGSLLIELAEQTAVPAGSALAVDRDMFAEAVTKAVEGHTNITVIREEKKEIPDGVTIIASGPLTSSALADKIAEFCNEDQLFFYDAISPIVSLESINMDIAYRASRYGRGEEDEGDYINCPFTKEEYLAFVAL